MQTTMQKLPKGLIDIEFELSPEEFERHLTHAAQEMSKKIKIEGFRPGNVPLEILKQRVGEMTLYEEAADFAIKNSYTEFVQKEKLKTIGQPEIEILKLAPQNPFVFRARVAVLPEVKLGDYKKIKIKRKERKIEEKEIENVLHDLQKMQTKEKLVKRAAGRHDKIVVDMDISIDKVPIEGGQAKNHAIYLDEPYYIPGLCDELIGLVEGQTREFALSFPKEHYQKNLAGKMATFKVTVKSVFELEHPVLDDAFAQSLGQENLENLKNLIRSNLEAEQKQKEEQRLEIEILEKIIESSRFEDIPEILVNAEAHKMLDELEEGITGRGLDFEEYLKKIGKNRSQVLLDFAPEAVKRIKAALVISQIAEQEKIEASTEEVDDEIKKMTEFYKDQPEMLEKIKSDELQHYFENIIRNRKTIEFLKKISVE